MRMGMGLALAVGSWLLLEQLDRLALRQPDGRLLGGGFDRRPVLEPADLALAVLGVDADDLHLVQVLDRTLDLVLARPAIHEERVLPPLVHREGALLGEDRLLDDVVAFHYAASPAFSGFRPIGVIL